MLVSEDSGQLLKHVGVTFVYFLYLFVCANCWFLIRVIIHKLSENGYNYLHYLYCLKLDTVMHVSLTLK